MKKIKHGCKNFKSNIKGMGSFVLSYNNSTNIETEGYYGISHLIEHCMCEPIKKYELDFERYGINYNAITEFTSVCFFITGLDDGIIKFRNSFYDSIVNYQIPKEVFERERNIVIQEYNDSLGRPNSVFYENIFRKYFNTRCPIGEKSDLENLTYEQFIEYKNKYFSKPTFVCNTSSKKIKKNEFETIKDIKKFEDVTGLSFDESLNIPTVKGTISDTSLYLGYFSKFQYNQETLEEYIYYTLISNYLCFGLSSPLYKELRENTGHVYSVSAFASTLLEQGNGYFGIIALTESKYETEIKEKLISCLQKYLSDIDENIFNNIVLGFKNGQKRARLQSYFNTVSFSLYFTKICKDYEFNFEKFKKYAKKLLESKYILINDKDL